MGEKWAAIKNTIGEDVFAKVQSSKILVIGAGGIGCELLKNLVCSGFQDITVVDLDTINVSNLNRQFLFRANHVGMSKAKVAAEKVAELDRTVQVRHIHGNVKDAEVFSADFLQSFTLVMNALDNVDARQHVNRCCINFGITLVESGTEGYLGQTQVIRKGFSECYACTPKPVPRTFAICTIRTTPEKPIHCVVYAREYLFPLFFGPAGEGGEEAARFKAAAECGAEAVFEEVFEHNVLILAESIRAGREARSEEQGGRAIPCPLSLLSPAQTAMASDIPEAADTGPLPDQKMWSLRRCASTFVESFNELKRASSGGALEFDKDDDSSMDFVVAAANLRGKNFGIPAQTRFDAQSMAGNIIPAIATANAVIASLQVLNAIHVLAGEIEQCRTVYKCAAPQGRRKLVLNSVRPFPPHRECLVCGCGSANVVLNVEKSSLAFFLDVVLKKHFFCDQPSLDINEKMMIEVVTEGEDAEEFAELQQLLPLPLVHPRIGFCIGTNIVKVVMDASKFSMIVTHDTEMDPEGEQQYKASCVSGKEGVASAPPPPAAESSAASAAGSTAAVEDSDDDIVFTNDAEGDGAGPSDPGKKRRRDE